MNPSEKGVSSLSGLFTQFVFSVFLRGMLPSIYQGALLTALVAPIDNAPIKTNDDMLRFVFSLNSGRTFQNRLLRTNQYKLIADKSKW